MNSGYLREQTRTIDPEYIVTLGNFATKFILKTDSGITRLRGTLQQAGRFKVFPIFHPAAALYDGSKRVALENDFATLGELLRSEASGRGAGPSGAKALARLRSVGNISVKSPVHVACSRCSFAILYASFYAGRRARFGKRAREGIRERAHGRCVARRRLSCRSANDKDRGRCIQSKPLKR